MKKRLLLLTAIVATAAFASGVAFAKQEQQNEQQNEQHDKYSAGSHFTAYSESKYPDLTYAAENAVRAVVGIDAIQRVEVAQRGTRGSYDPFLEFFGFPQQQQRDQRSEQNEQPRYREQKGGGSGVIISTDGYIVTNNHVIDGASKLRVKLYDGGTYDAEVIGTDPTTDIALIKIDKKDLPTIPMGSSDDIRLGEWVLAIGSPFDLQSTITAGIVSAKARQLDVIPSEFRIESFIQTDAAVNPGNSGGALVNTRGELIGINTLIKSRTGSYVGYSFAVPESIVRKVITDLREYGVVQRALLGISFSVINDDFIEERGKELGIKESGGAYVASISDGGAASEAGIRKGDIIISIDGKKITPKMNIQQIVAMRRPGDQIEVVVKRGSSMKHFNIVLRNHSGKTELVTRSNVDITKALGGRLSDVSARVARDLKIDGGVQVQSVLEGGALAKARVRRGFVITHINDRPILSMSDLERINTEIESIDGIYTDGRSASYNFVR